MLSGTTVALPGPVGISSVSARRAVIESLGIASRSANLPLLVAPLCPESVVAKKTDAYPLGRSATRLFKRRYALVALAAAGASAMLWRNLRSAGPALQTARWRSLRPVSTDVLLNVTALEKASFEVLDGDRIQVNSQDLALIQLGRPVVGLFSFRVSLAPQDQQRCGVFFRGKLMPWEGETNKSSFSFQTVELERGPIKLNGHQTASFLDRLTWNLWTASWQGETRTLICTPLAEFAVNLNKAAPTQQLLLTLGRKGMPEITFNGEKLHESGWVFSKEGHSRQRRSSAQLSTTFLGQLGLVSGKGSHTFEKPQLRYLRETHDA